MNTELKMYKEFPSHPENEHYTVDGKVYPVIALWEEAKKYKAFALPLDAIDLRQELCEVKNHSDLFYQCMKVSECDPDFPIILDNYGTIADGRRRVIKAMMEGRATIQAIRLGTMPRGFNEGEDE
jgi:hypothetical protein